MVSAFDPRRLCALACALVLAGAPARAEEPAPGPAKPAAAEAVPEITAAAGSWLATAEKGQWTKTRVTLTVAEGRTLTVDREQCITDVQKSEDGTHVTVASTSATGGNTGTHEQKFLVPAGKREPDPEPAAEKAPGETLTVAGEKLACDVTVRKLDAAGPAPFTIKTWTAAGVPFGGTVRIEHDGKPVFELLDFGPRKQP